MADAEYEKTKLGRDLWWTPDERDIVIDIHFKLPVDQPFGYWLSTLFKQIKFCEFVIPKCIRCF